MNEFEFVAVLISIVIGLGITHLLQGVAQAVHERHQTRFDSVHAAWTVSVFLVMVLNWWVLFTWRTHKVWTFDVFLLLILWAVALYLLVVFLYPPGKEAAQSWAAVYEGNRQWFLSAYAAMTFLDICITGVRGDLLNPPAYLPLAGHYFVLVVIGVFVSRRSYQKFLAWYILCTGLLWSLVVRRFLA
ncbi:MAG: hypothetical protein ACSLFK_14115 [Gemmatimonadaceae bacterium]